MSAEEYNGWCNRETWAAALHLNNDQRLQARARELAEVSTDTLEDWILCAVEDTLIGEIPAEEWLRLMIHDVGSFWRVDWDAVAASLLPEDVVEIGVGV